MTHLNTNSTAVIVAARALEDFAKAFPDEITIWIEQKPDTLEFTIQSILRDAKGSSNMIKRTWDNDKRIFTS